MLRVKKAMAGKGWANVSAPAAGRRRFRMVPCLALWAAFAAWSQPARADILAEGDRVMVQVGPYVYHRLDNTDHNQWPRLFGVEYETASYWIVGADSFRNSYYQDSATVYGGKRWFIDQVSENLYVKVAGGMVYGYRGAYEHKLPVNYNGFGLALVPALGYQFGRANVQLVFLGTAAAIVTIGYDAWR